MAYTVDEVSDLLDVPRPTLYRYLREYSIPHLRRSGKIYVPEESFDRIKEVRELHKEGLATESVRRRLQGESNLDAEELGERLDRISEALERLQGNLKPATTNGVSSTQALQTILARQSLLISAVYDLTEMLESFPYANGRHRKASDPEEETSEHKAFPEQLEELPKPIENEPVANEPIIVPPPKSTGYLATPTRRKKKRFGAMSRRRRRAILAVLLALLASIALVAYAALSDEEGYGASQEETSTPQEAAPAGPEELPARNPDAAPSSSAAPNEEESLGYAGEGYEGSARELPLYQGQYQAQYATPEPPSQERQPVLRPQPDGTGLPRLTFGNDSVQPPWGAPAP